MNSSMSQTNFIHQHCSHTGNKWGPLSAATLATSNGMPAEIGGY